MAGEAPPAAAAASSGGQPVPAGSLVIEGGGDFPDDPDEPNFNREGAPPGWGRRASASGDRGGDRAEIAVDAADGRVAAAVAVDAGRTWRWRWWRRTARRWRAAAGDDTRPHDQALHINILELRLWSRLFFATGVPRADLVRIYLGRSSAPGGGLTGAVRSVIIRETPLRIAINPKYRGVPDVEKA